MTLKVPSESGLQSRIGLISRVDFKGRVTNEGRAGLQLFSVEGLDYYSGTYGYIQ